MTSPKYQEIRASYIPKATLADNSRTLRVIAGSINGIQGPAQTYSPIELFDIKLAANTSVDISWPLQHHAALFVLSGSIQLHD